MKAVLFLITALVTEIAVAQPMAEGCEELSILYTSRLAALEPEHRLDAHNEIAQAFNTLCTQNLRNGDKVYYSSGVLAADQFNTSVSTLYYPNSSVMMERDADGDPVWYYPTGEMIDEESADELSDLIFGFERKVAKIEAPFKSQHKSCASSCTYVSWGIWGDEAHKKRRSCHNSGEAIDIHAIKCSGVTSKALSKRFDTYVACMKKKFKVLYRVKNHFGHAHIQIPNCRMIKLK